MLIYQEYIFLRRLFSRHGRTRWWQERSRSAIYLDVLSLQRDFPIERDSQLYLHEYSVGSPANVFRGSSIYRERTRTIDVGTLRGNFVTNIYYNEVSTTCDAIQTVRKTLLPTPSKFHYIFNMRDLSRIMAGLLQSHSNLYPAVKQFVRLWRNELTRVMCDRLISVQVISL